jgi:hypothetical protein
MGIGYDALWNCFKRWHPAPQRLRRQRCSLTPRAGSIGWRDGRAGEISRASTLMTAFGAMFVVIPTSSSALVGR